MAQKTSAQTAAERIAQLEAQLAEAQAKGNGDGRALTLKVSPKGALSVYGLGAWPCTLYAGQWQRLLAPEQVQAILDFIQAHKGTLSQGKGK